MLTVAKVSAGQADDYAEYLEAKSEPDSLGDYYLKDGDRVQAPGRWAGGARTVGCARDRPVDRQTLRQLMAVRRPDTGEPLRRAGSTGMPVAAIDATFSAPKSVSAVWALAAPGLRERIEAAHEHAIDRALKYSLRFVPMVRQRIDQQTVIHAKAKELVATSWRHTTARSVGGQPPDPQLHSHVLLHGAVRADGSVMAIDSRSWLVHRREVAAAYRTELASELARLGFGIRRGTGRARRYFEIQGVPEALVDRWSSRHHQVRQAIRARLTERRAELEAVIAGRGPDVPEGRRALAELESAVQLAPKVDRYLTAASRGAKDRLATRADLDGVWRRIAREHRFDTARAARLRAGQRQMTAADGGELLGRLTEFDAKFADREARAVALEASAGVPIDQALERLDELRVNGQLLELADQTNTTDGHRAAERQTAGLAAHLAASRVLEVPPALVQEEADQLDARLRTGGSRLSREQRAAIELACSDRQLVVIEGQAGSGKSTTLAAITRAHRSAGQDIVVTSTGGLAAERLAIELERAGAPARAYSIAAFHAAIDAGVLELSQVSTVIHDEAAVASTREQQCVLSAVQQAQARLIEVGDPRQSQPVGAGGLWPRIEEAADSNRGRVELTHNVRAKDPADQRDQQLFRQHQVEQAVRGYADRGRLRTGENPRQLEDLALDSAQADRAHGKRTLVIAQTSNEHLDELNARAQAIRHQAGELGRQGVQLPGRPYQLYRSDQIQVRHTIHHPDLGALRNGATGEVVDIASGGDRVTLRLANQQQVELERAQIEQADLRLAYVQHPFPAQGQTTDTAHLIVGEHATHEGSYVALTRGRGQTHIYANRDMLDLDEGQNELTALADWISRSEPEVPSIDTPLAHEQTIETEQDLEREEPERQQKNANNLELEHDLGWEL